MRTAVIVRIHGSVAEAVRTSETQLYSNDTARRSIFILAAVRTLNLTQFLNLPIQYKADHINIAMHHKRITLGKFSSISSETISFHYHSQIIPTYIAACIGGATGFAGCACAHPPIMSP
jgi:hypothetical protein